MPLPDDKPGLAPIPGRQAGFGVDKSGLAPVPQQLQQAAATPGPQAPQVITPGVLPQAEGLSNAPYRKHAIVMASKYGLDPHIFSQQLEVESGFDPSKTSSKGALGIGQLMPQTAVGLGVTDPKDPYANIEASAKYMAQLLAKYDGDYHKALAAYNAGPTAVDKHNGVPPFPETQQYLQKIIDPLKARLPAAEEKPGLAPIPQSVQQQDPAGAQAPPQQGMLGKAWDWAWRGLLSPETMEKAAYNVPGASGFEEMREPTERTTPEQVAQQLQAAIAAGDSKTAEQLGLIQSLMGQAGRFGSMATSPGALAMTALGPLGGAARAAGAPLAAKGLGLLGKAATGGFAAQGAKELITPRGAATADKPPESLADYMERLGTAGLMMMPLAHEAAKIPKARAAGKAAAAAEASATSQREALLRTLPHEKQAELAKQPAPPKTPEEALLREIRGIPEEEQPQAAAQPQRHFVAGEAGVLRVGKAAKVPETTLKEGVWTGPKGQAKEIFGLEKQLVESGRITQDQVGALRHAFQDQFIKTGQPGPKLGDAYAAMLRAKLTPIAEKPGLPLPTSAETSPFHPERVAAKAKELGIPFQHASEVPEGKKRIFRGWLHTDGSYVGLKGSESHIDTAARLAGIDLYKDAKGARFDAAAISQKQNAIAADMMKAGWIRKESPGQYSAWELTPDHLNAMYDDMLHHRAENYGLTYVDVFKHKPVLSTGVERSTLGDTDWREAIQSEYRRELAKRAALKGSGRQIADIFNDGGCVS